MAKNKIITSQGNVQFINSKGKVINMHPMHCYYVVENDTISFLFIYMKDYSGQAFFASQFEDLEVNGELYDNMEDLIEAINYAFAKAGAQARTEIVDELPETGFTNTIYLLPKEHGEGYDEYIYNEDEGWQLIGDTDIEFERYLQINDFDDYSAATEAILEEISGGSVVISGDVIAISAAVDTEIAAREAADAYISGAVDTVAADLASEVSRALSAETALGGRIDTVNGRVNDEQTARAAGDAALSGAIDSVSGVVETKADKANAVASAVYVSSSTTIDLKNISGDVISQVDASAFVIDGFVDEVKIENGYLVIVWNTDAGKQETRIPLTDIFDPSNYYDKAAVDDIVSGLNDSIDTKFAISDFETYSGDVETALGNKVNVSDFETYSGAVETELGNKFDASAITAYSTSSEVTAEIEAAVSGKVDTSAFTAYSASVETALGNKADLSALTEDERVWGEALNDLNSRINTVSGDVLTSGDVQTQIDNSISGKVDTSDFNTYSASVETALSGKQNTLTAGRGIDITNDVVSLDFPISAGTGVDSLLMSGSGNTASGNYSVAFGKLNTVSGECGVIMGNRNTSNNFAETAFGQKNVSRTEAASSFGSSGNTIFTVGNGIINVEQGVDANHNAFEIRGNGDIYIADTNAAGSYYEKPMIKLQDHLGGGSITVDTALDSGSTNPVENRVIYNKFDEVEEVTAAGLNALNESLSGKQDTLIAGDNITISGNVISAQGGSIDVDTALDSGSTNPVENRVIYNKFDEVEQVTAAGLNAVNDKFDGMKLKKISQTDYDNLQTKDNMTLYIIVD